MPFLHFSIASYKKYNGHGAFYEKNSTKKQP